MAVSKAGALLVQTLNGQLQDQLRKLESTLSTKEESIAKLTQDLAHSEERVVAGQQVIGRLRAKQQEDAEGEADEIQRLRADLAERERAVQELQSNVELLDQDTSNLLSRNDDLSKRLTAANDRADELQRELDAERTRERENRRPTTDDDVDGSVADATVLQGAVAERDRLRSELESLTRSTEAQHRDLSAECDRLRRQLQAASLDRDEHAGDVAAETEGLRRELDALTEENNDLRDECARLSADLDARRDDDSDLQQITAERDRLLLELEARSAVSHDDRSSVLASMRELLDVSEDGDVVACVARLIEDCHSAQKQAASIAAAYEQSQEELGELSQVHAALKAQYKSVVDQIATLQSDCRAAFANEEKSAQQVTTLRQQVEELQSRLSSVGKRDSSSTSRVRELERDVADLQDELQDKAAIIKELNAQIEARTKAQLELESRQEVWVGQAQRDTAQLTEQVARLRRELQMAVAERDTRVNEMQEKMRAQRDALRQAQLDLDAAEALAADYAALQKALDAKTSECDAQAQAMDNLQMVLDQFQSQSRDEVDQLRVELREQKAVAEEGRRALDDLSAVTSSLREAEDNIGQLEERLRSSRKYALQVENDNATLRHAMQQTIDRIRNFSSDENLVDRRLVNKLLVTFLEKKASDEVLNLMIRMLGFTDDQKRLILQSQRPRSLLGSFSSLIPKPYDADEYDASPPRNPAETQNLADLWVNFLLKETGSRRASRAGSIVSDQAAASGVVDADAAADLSPA